VIPGLETMLAFALTSLLIELTPGPNMTYLALVAARDGRRAGYAAVAGVAIGLALLGAAASVGLAALIASSDLLYSVLRWGGVAYLLFLAWSAWTERPGGTEELLDTRFFLRGLTTNLLNPKAAMFYVTVLPTFLAPPRDGLAANAALTAIYVLVATLVHAAIVTLAGILRPYLADPRVMSITARIFALALAAVAIWLAWTTR
jgi:threonine/homoserine/homoserine lactone efflux protein